MEPIISRLLASEEPSVRYKVLVNVCGIPPNSTEALVTRHTIPNSARVTKLLSIRNADGAIPGSPYAKYTGAHWTLVHLADLGYPPGDDALLPMRDQVYDMWLAPEHAAERVREREASSYKRWPGVPIIDGRARRCASQEGNALYSTLALGLADERVDQLAANLIRWQWPDGGWNCDRRATADTSSFMETLAPLRGLALHAKLTGSTASRHAAEHAAEVFLSRRLYKRRSDGEVINEDFTKLHYPCYWQYDILYALKVMAEAEFIGDDRCAEGLALLESKRLADGGFPAERRHYNVVEAPTSGGTLVDWGGVSKRRMNEFVTADALSVLTAAGKVDA